MGFCIYICVPHPPIQPSLTTGRFNHEVSELIDCTIGVREQAHVEFCGHLRHLQSQPAHPVFLCRKSRVLLGIFFRCWHFFRLSKDCIYPGRTQSKRPVELSDSLSYLIQFQAHAGFDGTAACPFCNTPEEQCRSFLWTRGSIAVAQTRRTWNAMVKWLSGR